MEELFLLAVTRDAYGEEPVRGIPQEVWERTEPADRFRMIVDTFKNEERQNAQN